MDCGSYSDSVHMSVHICRCLYVHMYTCTYVYMYIHMYLCTYKFVYTHTYIHIYIHTYIHIYINICICIYLQKATTYCDIFSELRSIFLESPRTWILQKDLMGAVAQFLYTKTYVNPQNGPGIHSIAVADIRLHCETVAHTTTGHHSV